MKQRIDQLVAGDIVDLEGDRYADPEGNPQFEAFAYRVVTSDRERHCVTVVFLDNEGDEFVCGFPPEHEVKIHHRRKA